MTYKKKEMSIALLTCYFQKYTSTRALNQGLSELFSYCPDAQVESALTGPEMKAALVPSLHSTLHC